MAGCPCTTCAPIRRIDSSYNTYGYPGLIDMPAAHSRPDGELAFTSSYFAGQLRNTLTFQMLPRLSGSFRYSALAGCPHQSRRAIENSASTAVFRCISALPMRAPWRPAMAVGLNDFLGTGIYSSEYVVATKTFGEQIRVTGGIGWGRLAGVGEFRNPLSLLIPGWTTGRARRVTSAGGQLGSAFLRRRGAFRRCPVAGDRQAHPDGGIFLGCQSQRDTLGLQPRYRAQFRGGLPGPARRVGVRALALRVRAGGAALDGAQPQGAAEGLGARSGTAAGGAATGDPGDLGWGALAQDGPALRRRVETALEGQGIGLHGFVLEGDTARLEIENRTYPRNAQAIGRTARSLTGVLPHHIERFVIAPVTSGVPGAQVEIARGDMETLEHDLQNTWQSYKRARITAADGTIPARAGRYPAFDWSLKPYLTPSFFDPDDPVRADLGAELKARFEPVRGLEFAGGLRKKVVGNLDESTRASDSVLPRVRSEFNIYDREGDPAITHLTGAYFFKPGRDLYGRVSAGYLEPMFGGVSGEILWKPVDSPFAIGVEANYVQQRDFDQLWGFRSYDVATGHVSAYWDLGNGFHTQLDVGRYLAKDWGATLSVDREFENGWRVGAFATLTDVPFSRFGEGSFDKGIRITIPISWVSGQPTRDDYTTTIRPVTRDGGARLEVDGRLYDRVRPLHKPELSDGWGRFWR